MILVNKPDAPATCRPYLNKGQVLTIGNCAAYDADPADYQSGQKKFDFVRNVYGNSTIKEALRRAQHRKCCYCEGIFHAHVSGDVEHYRPKGAIAAGARKAYPGYFWLSYAWENLFYGCPDCNQYRKGDQFPLRVEADRARSHKDDVERELPLLLCPAGPSDPRDHISFHAEVPVGISDEGRATVSLLKLDERPALMEKRLERLSYLTTLTRVAAIAPKGDPELIALVREAKRALDAAIEPQAEFSAMAQDFRRSR